MAEKLQVISLTVGQLQTNCYLIVDKSSHDTLIVDPGDDADYITRIISDHQLKPVIIIATHGHFDHILAAAELKLAFNIPFYIHKEDIFLVSRMKTSADHFLGVKTDDPAVVDGFLKDKVTLDESKLAVIHTSGHTPGSICLYSKEEKILFCGDLLFAQRAVGRTDFAYSSQKDLEKSLKRIFRLPGETEVYPGHGEPFNLQSW